MACRMTNSSSALGLLGQGGGAEVWHICQKSAPDAWANASSICKQHPTVRFAALPPLHSEGRLYCRIGLKKTVPCHGWPGVPGLSILCGGRRVGVGVCAGAHCSNGGPVVQLIGVAFLVRMQEPPKESMSAGSGCAALGPRLRSDGAVNNDAPARAILLLCAPKRIRRRVIGDLEVDDEPVGHLQDGMGAAHKAGPDASLAGPREVGPRWYRSDSVRTMQLLPGR